MRGDVFRLPHPPDARGHEQREGRFGVVVQATRLAGLSTWLVAPTSTSAAPAVFRAEVVVLDRPTKVLCEAATAIDPQRLGDLVGFLSLAEAQAVDEALRLVLDL